MWALVVLVLLGVGLRGYRLGSPYLWVDEAESALNALTIVADGVPHDTYMAQPLYENTLLRPWPEHPEYEFRDLSYSDRGLAVYHSWIPLYAMAAAFRVAGVSSEAARRGPPLRDASQRELAYWTAIPRLPALLFSAMLVIAAWGLGDAVWGRATAIAFAFATATSNFFIFAGRQARYYSAALAFDAIAGLCIWHACRRGRVRDHVLAGVSVGLLFHVHSVSAVTMGAVYVVCLPLARRQPSLWLRVLAAGAAGALLVLPWVLWSGLLDQATRQPMARDYVDWEMVVWSLPSRNPAIVATSLFGVLWFAAAALGTKGHARWKQPILELAAPMYFATVWLFLSYAVFVTLMPAASFAPFRLRLPMSVPGTLLLVLVVAALCRALRPGWPWLPVAGLVGFLLFTGQLPPQGPGWHDPRFSDLIAQMRSWTLRDGRVYSTPNDHLALTYYSGVPVQNVNAVRRSWLDGYQGDLVVIEAPTYDMPQLPAISYAARQAGVTLTEKDAREQARLAMMRATTVTLRENGVNVSDPPAVRPPVLEEPLFELVHAVTRANLRNSIQGTPFGRQAMLNWREFRHHFFYWFADPASRTGAALNYRACLTAGRSPVHPTGYVIFDCRARNGPPLVPEDYGDARLE